MARLLIAVLLFIFFVLQLTLMPRLTVFGVSGNILLAAILVFAIKSSGNWVLVAAFLSGLALDLFSALPFGVWVISFSVTVWLIGAVGKKNFKSSDFSGQAILISLACLLFSVFGVFLPHFFSWIGFAQNSEIFKNILKIILPEFILNAILALIFILFYKNGLRARI